MASRSNSPKSNRGDSPKSNRERSPRRENSAFESQKLAELFGDDLPEEPVIKMDDVIPMEVQEDERVRKYIETTSSSSNSSILYLFLQCRSSLLLVDSHTAVSSIQTSSFCTFIERWTTSSQRLCRRYSHQDDVAQQCTSIETAVLFSHTTVSLDVCISRTIFEKNFSSPPSRNLV